MQSLLLSLALLSPSAFAAPSFTPADMAIVEASRYIVESGQVAKIEACSWRPDKEECVKSVAQARSAGTHFIVDFRAGGGKCLSSIFVEASSLRVDERLSSRSFVCR